MPITKSAKKSLKVSRTKKAANDIQRIALSKALKTVDAKTVNHTVSLIDKAAKTGLMHKNKAARLKSRLAKKYGTPAAAKKTIAPMAKEKKTTAKTTKKSTKVKVK